MTSTVEIKKTIIYGFYLTYKACFFSVETGVAADERPTTKNSKFFIFLLIQYSKLFVYIVPN